MTQKNNASAVAAVSAPSVGRAEASRADIGRAEITQAATRIAAYVRKTPALNLDINGLTVNVKLEQLQVSGTFKARGAFNRWLSSGAKQMVAASGGNHGIAVAYAAKALGMKAHIFVPATAPVAKVKKLQALGAEVHQIGSQYAEALAASMSFAEEHAIPVSHAYDQFETLCGQGTVAREWQEQSPKLDTVLIAVGGGGLIGGMAAWYRGDVKIVAVETETCATLHRALKAGEPVDIEVSGYAADALGAKRVGSLMFPIAQQHISQSVLVSDAAVRAAQLQAWHEARIAAEPAGAAAWAALASGAYVPAPGERVGVLVCGANMDPTQLLA
jgi:threonine dehydratase